MQFHNPVRLRARSRGIGAGVPVAVVGSIALALGTSPASAVADERDATATRSPGIRLTANAIPATYVVVQGDTVSSIAARFGLRTADVLALNGLGWSSIIRPGQVLKLTAPAPKKPAAKPTPAPPATTTYTVRTGDTISSIAQRHGVSIGAVFGANGLGWSSIIYPGQRIAIPGAAKAPAAAPKPAAPKSTPPAASTYIVRAGDTISGIAQHFGLTAKAVLIANELGWSSIIYPGEQITIPAAADTAAGLDAEQVANAKLIIQVGRDLGVSDRGIAIALGTSMQESWLRNLDWGDKDSLGLFQQRPSTGWGSEAQVRDPVRAIKAFFGGASDPNGSRTRGLLDIEGWESMSFAAAAQAVQISAYPERYARWEQPANAWLAALG